MSDTIKSIFDEECKKVRIDASFIRQVRLYQVGFVNKNEDHIAFFGGHLLGVHTVKFMPQDRDRWFSDILKTEPTALESRLLRLDAIDPEHKIIGSDTMNLSCAWLVHAILTSKNLNDKQKQEAAMDVMLILQYKFLTSRLYQHFRYPADKATAEATYAELSGRFLIKQHGTYGAVLKTRAGEIIMKGGIHYDTFISMKVDDDVIDLLNDIQGRIRDMIKNIYDVFLRVHHQGDRIIATSAVIEHDGAEILRDKTKNLTAYGRYINSIVTDKNSFIREDLVNVITNVMHTMPSTLFRTTLEYMSDNYRQRGAGEIEEILHEVLVHSFDYLADHRELVSKNTDLPYFIGKLRGVYMSSRSTDVALFSLREKTERLVRRATNNRNDSVIASVRTGVLLYVVLRAFTMRYYTTSG